MHDIRDPSVPGTDFDVAIVGGGPAGLVAAAELARHVRPSSLCILERGGLPGDRSCPVLGDSCLGCPECNLIEGFGGAGFHVDGKLCEDPEVAAEWDRLRPNLLTDTSNCIESARAASGTEITSLSVDTTCYSATAARRAGFEVTAYPVRLFGTDRVRRFNASMVLGLQRQGVRLLPDADVVNVVPSSPGFEVAYSSPTGPRALRARRVLIAVGRSGASWLQNVADGLGIPVSVDRIDLGLRVEVPAAVLRPLESIGGNPKLKLRVGPTYVKTHCLCASGYVVSYAVKVDDVRTQVVDGHSFHERKSPSSNVNLLMRIDPEVVTDPVTYAHSVAWNTNLVGKGALVVQRLGDLRCMRPSEPDRSIPIDRAPSLRCASFADLNMSYPRFVVDGILRHLDALNQVCPGIAADDVTVYGPALEWGVGRPEVDSNFQTPVAGLYLAGDATGKTTGVLTAAATGFYAAQRIAEGM